MKIDRQRFFDHVRPLFGGSMTQPQVDGCELIIGEFERRLWSDLRHLAYIFATVQHETAATMQPVRETLASSDEQAVSRLENAWKAGKLPSVRTPYWRDGFFGRGLLQITWRENYQMASAKLGLGNALVDNPAKVMEPTVALDILFDGMAAGWFTGKKLADYFDSDTDDWVGARFIINGQDRAAEIGRLGQSYRAALRKAGV